MAGRPSKTGLDYFPFDTDMDQDKKIRLLEIIHPADGWKFWTKILPRLYKDEGYFFEANIENLQLLSRDINVDINSIEACINTCIKQELFNKDLWDRFQILSSKRIQINYLHATQRRKKVWIIKDFLLLSLEEVAECNRRVHFLIYDDINSIMVDNKLINDYRKVASDVISFTLLYHHHTDSNKNNKGDENFKTNNGSPDAGERPPAPPSPPVPHSNEEYYDPAVKVDYSKRPKPLNWSWEKAYFTQADRWVAEQARFYQVTEDQIRATFPSFFKMCENANDYRPAERMWLHFHNWFPFEMEHSKKLKNRKDKQDYSGKEKPSDAYDKIQYD